MARERAPTTITEKDGDDSQRVNRVVQACGTHCHFCCVDLVCARSTHKNHTQTNCKMSYCFFHHTFRTHHAALDLSLLPHLQLRGHPPSVALPLLRHLDATMFLLVPLLACVFLHVHACLCIFFASATAVLAPGMATIIITHFVLEFACDVNS